MLCDDETSRAEQSVFQLSEEDIYIYIYMYMEKCSGEEKAKLGDLNYHKWQMICDQ